MSFGGLLIVVFVFCLGRSGMYVVLAIVVDKESRTTRSKSNQLAQANAEGRNGYGVVVNRYRSIQYCC